MIKKIIPFMLIIVCVIAVFGCSGKTPVVGTISGSDKNVTVKTESANSKSGMTVFQLFPTKFKVQDFLDHLTDVPIYYENDECFNVTPEEIYAKYGFFVFKYDKSCAGYLMVGDQIYPIPEYEGGFGVSSFAVADMNSDGQIELYFITSSGSGLHSSRVGYFDFATKKMLKFAFLNYDSDMMFSAEDDKLILYNATLKCTSFVDIKNEKTNAVGEILFEKNTIVLKDYSEGSVIETMGS